MLSKMATLRMFDVGHNLMVDQPTSRKQRQPFSKSEDQTLAFLVKAHGQGSKIDDWNAIANAMPGRTSRQCRDRWKEYLMPELNSSPWTAAEDENLISQIRIHGKRWSIISPLMGRSETNIKNRWRLLERRKASHSSDNEAPQPSGPEDLSQLFKSLNLPVPSADFIPPLYHLERLTP